MEKFGDSGAEDGSCCMHPQSSPAQVGSGHTGGIYNVSQQPRKKVIRAEPSHRAGGHVTDEGRMKMKRKTYDADEDHDDEDDEELYEDAAVRPEAREARHDTQERVVTGGGGLSGKTRGTKAPPRSPSPPACLASTPGEQVAVDLRWMAEKVCRFR